jgi:hypothetical protein
VQERLGTIQSNLSVGRRQCPGPKRTAVGLAAKLTNPAKQDWIPCSSLFPGVGRCYPNYWDLLVFSKLVPQAASSATQSGLRRGGANRRGAGGAKGRDQGECGQAAHAPDSAPHKRVTDAGSHTAAHSCCGYPRWEPYAGKLHVRDLCGGCEATRVPTATKAPGKAGAISRCKSGPGKA